MATTETVSIDRGGRRSMEAEVIAPDEPTSGPRRGVIVLHEIMGMNDDIRRLAGRLVAEGYVAVVPNLYSGGGRVTCLSRVLLSQAVDRAERAVLDDIEAARLHLANRDDVDADRVAVIGFCMGGGFALAFAASHPAVRVASVNYGAVPKDAADLTDVCPVVASFGRADRIFAKQGDRLGAHLQTLGIPNDVKIYEAVGHSFMSYDNGPAWMARLPSPMHVGFAEEEAEDAWRRILSFFDTHLSAKS
ncbi:MAG: dienelactone hydrolase family protein [Acidimicrobiales bacterium]